ncbi:hypothetical protein Pmani_001454 [Petrolisthes manimaculis]|uniref:Uncharacterized protein n=1 Tax=Petrolisthes manimaculis TaxID=1843537 RepID=A0AAE1QKK5_9EUCA|nr:hypothetical protein Pmani_001454 [Petrolisthes manimaculis]
MELYSSASDNFIEDMEYIMETDFTIDLIEYEPKPARPQVECIIARIPSAQNVEKRLPPSHNVEEMYMPGQIEEAHLPPSHNEQSP